MLVKARARRKDNHLSQELNELERRSQVLFKSYARNRSRSLYPMPTMTLFCPCQRLASINEMLVRIEHYLQGAQGVSAVSKNTKHEHEQTLLDDFQHQQQQLKHLMAGRERAREESRLKTGYLTLLQRETDGLLDHLNVMAGKEATDNGRQNVTEVHERLLDIRSLLANLVQQSAESTEKPTEKAVKKH
ncbi:hypothetical protein HSBAA_20600 [Vreelandella sulfidaeris]|uniref:Uncharacterized protein n=1 Tax=Vreelandella sulfidaeris TaxID=115553 RepID=A0A455UC05_9GAMM|nr:hypothetical protein HSBAA_20600 [Halomonas sulfidaeris]